MNIYDDDYSPENEKEEDKKLIEELKKFKNLEEEDDEQGVFGSNEDEDALFEMISASVSKQHGAGPKSDDNDVEDDLLDYRKSQMANTYNPDDDHTRILFDDRGLPVFDENGELIYVDEDYYVNHSLFKEIDIPNYDAVETLSEEKD